jgi:hypothetical protein
VVWPHKQISGQRWILPWLVLAKKKVAGHMVLLNVSKGEAMSGKRWQFMWECRLSDAGERLTGQFQQSKMIMEKYQFANDSVDLTLKG